LLTTLRSRIFVSLLVCGVLATVSVCPTRCLAAQLHASAKGRPCHSDTQSPAHAALALSCCPPPMMVQAAFDVPQIVPTDFVVIEPPDVDDAPMILFDAAPRAVEHPPPLYVLHHSLLI